MRQNSKRSTLANDTESAQLNVLGENRVLAGLPATELKRLTPHLERVTLHVRDELYRPNLPIDHAYFPLSGVLSVVVDMENGSASELGTVGNEGMIGVPLVHGVTTTNIRTFAQISGAALRMDAEVFMKEMKAQSALARRASLHAVAWMGQVGQSTACNVRHSIEKRMCRWLLQTRDRVGANEFGLTHEFLGQMLGVRRPSVTVVAGLLQSKGLISYRRGVMTIEDEHGLEQEACECYGVVKREYVRLLGTS